MQLDESAMRKYLQIVAFNESIDFHIFSSIDSTNRYLKDLPPTTSSIILCCAEMQTQGRGRMQRMWYSPPNDNIYCSFRWQFPKTLSGLSTLSLVVSLAVLHSLQTFPIADNIQIKWPNDIIWQDKKLCGILIETSTSDSHNLNLVVGIGLNVNSDPKTHTSTMTPTKPWCSLYQITQQHWDRNELIASLVQHTHHYVTMFKNEGFKSFLPLWQRSDYLYGKQVSIQQMNQKIEGIAQGISEQGELLILDHQRDLKKISCGEASIMQAFDLAQSESLP